MLRVALKPQSRREGVSGLQADYLKVAVKAPAVEGKANRALIDALARLFGCSRSQVAIEQGQACRNKLVSFVDLDKSRILSILEKLLSGA